MPITSRRRKHSAPPATRFEKLQGLAKDRAEQFGPAARAARHNAEERVLQARERWAPRLETAAHRVEDTVAPRVASALSATARRVEPKSAPARRRVPRAVVITGIVVAGAVVAIGVYQARRTAQEAEWQENLDRVREQVRETKDQVVSSVRRDDDEAKDEQTRDANGRVRT